MMKNTNTDRLEGLSAKGKNPAVNLWDNAFPVRVHSAKRGFTLIELLVVVLIIGILAAVAVPQYQTAVARSRYQQLVLMGTAVARAEEAYYLANGQYTTDFGALDLDFGNSSLEENESGPFQAVLFAKGYRCTLRDYAIGTVQCSSSYTDVPEFQITFATSERKCHNYYNKGSVAQRICRLETNSQVPTSTNSEYESYTYK